MNRKKLITILATTTILATLIAPMLLSQFDYASAVTYGTDNIVVNGVLASDSYVLYPYRKENLIFGISKYGEMINGVADQGLEYDGMDVFANLNVQEEDWSQGWFIDIHYAGKDNSYKNVWAFAMYTDLSGSTGIGGDWKEGCTLGPLGAPHGGRKTNAWATTDDIKILYDGPRRFVALTKTTLYEDSAKTKALVSITITFVFNKVKKHVVLFKDIKRLDLGKWGRTFQVEFSNRGEWDIGTTAAPPSYAHFYDNLATVYDYEYHDFYNATYDVTGFDAVQMINEGGSYVGFAAFWPQLFGKIVDGTDHITPDDVLSSLCTKMYNRTWLQLGSPTNKNITFSDHDWPTAELYPRGDGLWSDEPMVFQNGILLSGGGVGYTWYPDLDKIVFTAEPLDTDYIIVVYKHELPEEIPEVRLTGGYDDMSLHTTEPKTPYVIGEWCFDLEDEDRKRQFRAVTLYGLTDRHDGDDDDAGAKAWSAGANVIDGEVQYYLNETFNPFDLYDAVHKQEYRWLYKDTLTSATSYITLTDGIDETIYNLTKSDATFTAEWVNEYEDGIDAHSKNWAALMQVNCTLHANEHADLKIIPPGAGTTLTFKDLVDLDFWYYLYASPSPTYAPHICVYLSKTGGRTSGERADITMMTNTNTTTGSWLHVTLPTIADYVGGNGDQSFHIFYDSAVAADWGSVTQGPANPHSLHYWQGLNSSITEDYIVDYIQVELGWWGSGEAKALIDDVSIGYLDKTSGIKYQRVYNLEEDKLIPSDWDAYCSFAERVLIDGVLIERDGYHNSTAHESYYTINFETGNLTFSHWVTSAYTTWTLPIGTYVKVLYSTIEENEKGRYEWMVVGKDAATIDSLSAAYVTEAFDSRKDIEVLMAGMDINETVYGPYAPFVMGGANTGTKADYRDTLGRPHLRDDWCNTTAISSSNMIFEGGSTPNLGTEYFNEFTMAYQARAAYVTNDTGHANKILALSCWNRTYYGSGYAAISVYKDINGTIGFLIWGYDGQDTYYASKWFWDTGIVYLQTENRGVTDIVLKITYPTADPIHPTFSIVERLGTISEKTPHDC